MEDDYQKSLLEISERILDAKDQVSTQLEDKNYKVSDVEACHEVIRTIGADFAALLETIPEAERDAVDRHYGRMITDLRRFADALPALSGGGMAVPLSTRSQWKIGPQARDEAADGAAKKQAARPYIPRPRPSGPRVGAEIEAWCGPCKRQTTHRIIAMVGEEPKQVVCQSCDARHKFRLTPARGPKADADKSKKDKLTVAQVEARKKEEANTELQKELVSATDVRTFTRRGRYRAGEIIEHPEYGRGKVENVIRGSILVRFRAGLRPLPTD